MLFRFLFNNALSGTMPRKIGNFNKLKVFDITDTRFSGLLPIELEGLPSLTALDLQRNHFEGPLLVPSSGQLGRCRVNGNQFSGSFPDLSPQSNLGLL